MSLQYLSFSAIGESDLARLVNDGVAESKTLEYKEAFLITTDEQKREFLSDVTALANTDGGDLVLGMKAEKGVAKKLVGLRSLIPDDAKSRIENLLRDFVQPRLAGHQICAIPLSNDTHALLIRVPRSFAAPHMVRHLGITRFCGRNSNGKYDLDVQQLRSAFLASEALSDRLKSFRIDRINRLLAGNGPVSLVSPHLMVLHVLPVVGARPDIRLATADLQRAIHTNHLRPIASSGWTTRFNFDGLLVAYSLGNEACGSLVQVFRNGFLEAVDGQMIRPEHDQTPVEGVRKWIPSISWEQAFIEVLPGYFRALTDLGLPAPYGVSLSLLNVHGFSMYVDPRYSGHGAKPVDRDHLLTDEILVESTDDKAGRILRPLFDQVWNGCGWYGSLNYDEAGNWRPHK